MQLLRLFPLATLVALPAAGLHARELMELEGIQLRGSARVVAYGAATCEIREGFAGDDKAYDSANRGRPLDLWQVEFSVFNGSNKWLDHLIARYNVESEWPPCSSWDGPPAGTVDGIVVWAGHHGFIQKTGRNVVAPGETLTETIHLVVFSTDPAPYFEHWSMNYKFAVSPPRESTGGTENVRRPARLPPTTVPPPGRTCKGERASKCWMEVPNRPGCYVWQQRRQNLIDWLREATWNGRCAGGVAEGPWTIRSSHSVNEGLYEEGKKHGLWTENRVDGTTYSETYRAGMLHGPMTVRHPTGVVEKHVWRDGTRRDPTFALSEDPAAPSPSRTARGQGAPTVEKAGSCSRKRLIGLGTLRSSTANATIRFTDSRMAIANRSTAGPAATVTTEAEYTVSPGSITYTIVRAHGKIGATTETLPINNPGPHTVACRLEDKTLHFGDGSWSR